MSCLPFLWLTFLLSTALPATRGFVNFIKQKDFSPDVRAAKYFCYTDETDSAVAFIANLNKESIASHSGASKYSAILNAAHNSGRSDCNLMLEGKCDAWDVHQFDRVDSFLASPENLPPILDRRWNDLTENLVSEGNREVTLLELKNVDRGAFSLSLLANEANILFTRSDDHQVLNEGFLIAIDDEEEYHRIEKWDPSLKNSETILSALHKRLVLSRGNEWKILTIKYNLSKTKVSLQVEQEGEMILKIDDVSTTNGQNSTWKVKGIMTKKTGPALFKLHEYDVLKPKKGGAEMRVEVEFSEKQPFCLDVTYLSGGAGARKGIAAEIKDAKGTSSNSLKFEASPKNEWATKKIAIDALEAGKYAVTIKTASETTLIGDVRFCVSGPELVETSDWAKNCHSLKPSKEKIPFSASENGLSNLEAEAVCKTVSNDDCRQVQFCDSDQENCACLSGFRVNETSGRCDASCAGQRKFGADCRHDFVGHCVEGRFSIHTGHCEKGCLPSFRPPSCAHKLLEFDIAPIVAEVSAYKATLHLTFAMKILTITKASEIQFLHSVDLQLQKLEADGETWSSWSTVKTLQVSDSSYVVELENVRPASKYNVASVVREKGGQAVTQVWPTASFQTPKCTSLDTKSIRIEPLEGFNLRVKKINENDRNLCRVSKVEFLTDSAAPTTVDGADGEHEAPAARVVQNKVKVFGDDGHSVIFDQVEEQKGNQCI